MNDVSNFYVTGGTLPGNAVSYVQRQADETLFNSLRQHEFCYVLTSRQMGKSSLMVRTSARLRDAGVHTAVVDLTSLGQNLTVDQWYKGILNRIGQGLGIEAELDAFWYANTALPPLERWLTSVQKVMLTSVRDEIVLFIDEIDMVRSLVFQTDEFFAGIRACYNRREEVPDFNRLTFCLLGVASPSDLILDSHITPFNIGRRIELFDFTADEASTLAVGISVTGRDATKLMSRILYWTNGQPYLTQRLCAAVADDDTVMTPANVDRLCRQLFFSQDARQIESNLAFVSNRILKSGQDVAALLDLYRRVLMVRNGVEYDPVDPLCEVLSLSGIVRVESDRMYNRNRIYEHVFDRVWVASIVPDDMRRQWRAFRRGVVMSGAAAGLVLGLIGGIAGIAIRNAARARFLAHEATVQRGMAEKERDSAQNLAYNADMNLIPQSYEQNDFGRIRSLLDETRASKYRGFEWGYWNGLCHLDLCTLSGHSKDVISAVFSPDGHRIATGYVDGTVTLWDASSFREIRTLGSPASATPQPWAHTGIAAMVFSPDSRRIVAGSYAGTVKIWDSATGGLMLTLKLTHMEQSPFPCSVAFSPDCSRVAMGLNDGTTNTWDVATGRAVRTLGRQGNGGIVRTSITAVVFSPDGRRIATGRQDGLAQIWDAATGAEILTFRGHSKTVFDAAFSPDGGRIFTGSFDGTAKIWDASSGRNIITLKGLPFFATHVGFSPDGTRIVTACNGGQIFSLKGGTAVVWDAANGRQLLSLRGHSDMVNSVAFSHDGKRIVTTSHDGTAKVWDAASDREPLTIREKTSAYSIAFSRNDRQIITSNHDPLAWSQVYAKMWDAATGRVTCTINLGPPGSDAVALSPDDQSVVSGICDGSAKIWDAVTGREKLSVNCFRENLAFNAHPVLVSAVAFSPDGLRTVTGSSDGRVTVWDSATGHVTFAFRAHGGYVSAVEFSPDGRCIVTGGGDATATVWDAATGHETLALVGHNKVVRSAAFSPIGNSTIVRSAAFSPDGKCVVTACEDGTASVWDAATGRELLTLSGHSRAVNMAAFSADGKRIVTGSTDGLVKVWDAATGRETLTLNGQCGSINCVAFSHDGKRIAAGGDDRTMMIWSAEPCKLSDGAVP